MNGINKDTAERGGTFRIYATEERTMERPRLRRGLGTTSVPLSGGTSKNTTALDTTGAQGVVAAANPVSRLAAPTASECRPGLLFPVCVLVFEAPLDDPYELVPSAVFG